jgi:Skp family chaperone for outer membrane proteins
MGMLRKAVRRATPSPVRQIERAVTHPVRTSVRAVTPRPIRNLQRSAFNVAHPMNTAENAVLNSVVPWSRRTSGSSSESPNAGYAPGSTDAAWERASLAQQIADSEATLLSAHRFAPPSPSPGTAPAPQLPDTDLMRVQFEEKRGAAELRAELAAFGVPPKAPCAEPVDSAAIYRQLRGQMAADVYWWQLSERRAVRHKAKVEASERAETERTTRQARVDELQRRLDAKWTQFQAAVDAAERDTQSWAAAEVVRRREEQVARQAELDKSWADLCANDPDAVAAALQEAFADAGAVHTVGAADGCAAVVIEMHLLEDLVADYEPASTSSGRLTVQVRSKTSQNQIYQAMLASRLLRVMTIAFTCAPSLNAVSCVVIRPTPDDTMTPIYAGTFERTDLAAYQQTSDVNLLAELLEVPDDAVLNLRGRTHEVSDLDLEHDSGLQAAKRWIDSSPGAIDHEVAAQIIGSSDEIVDEENDVPDFPQRITAAWLGANVPEMTSTTFARLLDLLRDRGWDDGEITERVVALRAT